MCLKSKVYNELKENLDAWRTMNTSAQEGTQAEELIRQKTVILLYERTSGGAPTLSFYAAFLDVNKTTGMSNFTLSA